MTTILHHDSYWLIYLSTDSMIVSLHTDSTYNLNLYSDTATYLLIYKHVSGSSTFIVQTANQTRQITQECLHNVTNSVYTD